MNKLTLKLKTLFLTGLLLAAFGSIYPQYLYTEDTCSFFSEAGEEEQLCDDEIFKALIKCPSENIQVKSKLFEFFSRVGKQKPDLVKKVNDKWGQERVVKDKVKGNRL